MSYNIKLYEEEDKSHWDNFLKNCKNYHFMFHRDYMEYHSHKFKDFSLIISNNKGNIVALLPGNIDNSLFYSHQGLTFGGFLVDKNMRAGDFLNIFEEIKSFLKENNINQIIYKCIPNIYHSFPAQEDLYVLFRNRAELYRRDLSTSILLSESYKYSNIRKRGIKKAKKENIICKEIENISEVWFLIRAVLATQHDTEPVHSEKEIDYLKSLFPKNIKAYAALKDKKIIATTILFINKDVVHTQYLATDDIGREFSALDFLLDYVIEESKKYAKIFDFGISNEDNGRVLNLGLINQKEGFGARGIVHDFYKIDL